LTDAEIALYAAVRVSVDTSWRISMETGSHVVIRFRRLVGDRVESYALMPPHDLLRSSSPVAVSQAVWSTAEEAKYRLGRAYA